MRTEVTTRYDDLVKQANGMEVEAQQTVSVGLNGQWWEIDLTDENFDQLSRYLLRYMTAGRIPEKAAPARKRKAGKGQGKTLYDTRPRDYYTGLREWMRTEKGKEWDKVGSPQRAGLKAEYDDYLKGSTE